MIPECAGFIMDRQISLIEARSSDSKPCKDEIRLHCSKQIDALKKAVQDTSIVGIIKGAVETAECLAENVKAIAEKCNPFKTKACDARIEAFCPMLLEPFESPDALLDASSCLSDKQAILGDECVARASQPIVAFIDSSSSKCHDQLRKDCGKELDALKKEVQDTSVIGTIKSVVDVVACISHHAEDLINNCFSSPSLEVSSKPLVFF